MKNSPQVSGCELFAGDLKLRGFKIYEVVCGNATPSYNRRDFYKICLSTGNNRIHYADKGIETEGTILFFGNPRIPYSWETLSESYSGFTCLFTEDFLKAGERLETLQESPLFRIGGTPIFPVEEEQKAFITTLFRKMLAEQDADYVFKDELIRNYISLIIHEAMKMQPSENYFRHKNAASRIASLFFDLLERQFPVETTEHPLKLRTAQDFARHLSVHVNHLNRSVREVTGKPTTAHISERIVSEARALLQHTDWSIADIAYALGFEYPTYFNNYFKRMTGSVPRSVRA